MSLPFTQEQFLQVMHRYYEAVEDLGLLPAGLVGLWLAWRPAQRMRLA